MLQNLGNLPFSLAIEELEENNAKKLIDTINSISDHPGISNRQQLSGEILQQFLIQSLENNDFESVHALVARFFQNMNGGINNLSDYSSIGEAVGEIWDTKHKSWLFMSDVFFEHMEHKNIHENYEKSPKSILVTLNNKASQLLAFVTFPYNISGNGQRIVAETTHQSLIYGACYRNFRLLLASDKFKDNVTRNADGSLTIESLDLQTIPTSTNFFDILDEMYPGYHKKPEVKEWFDAFNRVNKARQQLTYDNITGAHSTAGTHPIFVLSQGLAPKINETLDGDEDSLKEVIKNLALAFIVSVAWRSSTFYSMTLPASQEMIDSYKHFKQDINRRLTTTTQFT